MAAIALFALAGSGYFTGPNVKTYTTPIGGHEIVTLSDGTSIELNTDTSIKVAFSGGARNITLERGEGYFQVMHDPAHPFVVRAGTHRVVDIGTKFLLRKYAAKVELALYEGEASFESLKSGEVTQKAILKPGDVVVAVSNHPGFRTTRSEPADVLVNKLAWQRGFVVMDHTTLADVVRDLNRYNVEKIIISDPAAARMQMYGTIPINGVDGFVRVAQGVLGLRAIRRGNEIEISK
jgi:transmembrane sensor